MKWYQNGKGDSASEASVIWDILGDFWRLFEDRAVVEEIWGATVDVVNNMHSQIAQTRDSLSIQRIPVFWEANWEKFGPLSAYEDSGDPEFPRRIVIDPNIVEIPELFGTSRQAAFGEDRGIKDADYKIANGYLYFGSRLTSDYYWAPVLKRNTNNVSISFGAGLNAVDVTSDSYYIKIAAIWRSLWHGPTVSSIHSGLNAIMGYPFAVEECTVLNVTSNGDVWSVELSNGDIFMSSVIPVVTIGQRLYAFDPIFNAVQIKDRVSHPGWWVPSNRQVKLDTGMRNLDSGKPIDNWVTIFNKTSGLAQFHTFKVQVAYDFIENSSDDLKYAKYFLDRIKPAYTSYVMEIDMDIEDVETNDITDSMEIDQIVAPVEEFWPDGFIDYSVRTGVAGVRYVGL